MNTRQSYISLQNVLFAVPVLIEAAGTILTANPSLLYGT